MRRCLLIGLLMGCSAIAAHSQKLTPPAEDARKGWDWSSPQKDALINSSNDWRFDFGLPHSLPGKAQPSGKDLWSKGSSLDGKFIFHPSRAWAETISPAVPTMQDRYPGLKIQPLSQPENKTEARLEEIPVTWPELKIEAIPSAWPKLKLPGVQEESSEQIPRLY